MSAQAPDTRAAGTTPAPPHPLAEFWRYFSQNHGAVAGLAVVLLVALVAIVVITALTAQNSLGVAAVHAVPPAFIRSQLRAVLDDMKPRFAKTGMLATADIVSTVAAEIGRADLEGLVVAHDDALVIVTTVSNNLVKQVLIDNGSSCDLLFWEPFQKIGLNASDLQPMKTQIIGFNNHS